MPRRAGLSSVRKVPEAYPALDWLARRHAGQSCAHIAQHAGVTEETVRRATRANGPFPRPTQQDNRTALRHDVLTERTRRSVEGRRQGRSATDMARADGVSHQLVSRATRAFGPFPATEVVKAWVDARGAGRTLAAIADAAGVKASVVRRETANYGPFPSPGARLP